MGGPRSMASQDASGLQHRKSTKLLVQHFEHAISTEHTAGLNTHYSSSHNDVNHPGLSRAYTTNSHNLQRKPPPSADDAQLETSRKTKSRSTYYYDPNHRFQSQPPLSLPSSSAPTTLPTIRDRDKDKSPLRHSFRNLLTLLKKGSGKLGASIKDSDRDKPIFPPPKLSTTTAVHRGRGNASSQSRTKKDLPLLPIPLNDVMRPILSRSQSRSGTLIYLTTGDAGAIANDPASTGDKRPPIWTTANISLDNGKIALSWYTDSGRRGDMMTPCVHEIDLIGCTDIRSMDVKALDPHSAEALEAWGSGNDVGEDEGLKIFEILFERKHRELFAVRSVRERAKWISAFWDAILPPGSGEGTSTEPLPGKIDESKSHGEEGHSSRPTSAVPPRLTSRTNTERSLPPLPTSQLSSNKSNFKAKPPLPALTIPGKSNDSFVQITNAIVKSDSSSDSRTPGLPTPLKMRPHPSSQSRRVLQVKNGIASPTSMYSRSAASAFSSDSGQSSSAGTARRLSSSRPASPSITNLSQLSVVKQRLAQLERTASASPSLQLSVRSSGGASVSSAQSGSELRRRGWGGSGPGTLYCDPAGRTRAGSPLACARVRSCNEPERVESRKELSIDDSDAGGGSHEGGRAGGSRGVGDPPAVKNTGASRTTGLATLSVGVEGSVWKPVSGLPLPELGPGGLISPHASSAPEESQFGGEKQLGLDLHREEDGPSASARGDGGDEVCTPSGGFVAASAIHNESGVFGKDRQLDEPVSITSEDVGGLAAISNALRYIKSVLGGPGSSPENTNGNLEDVDNNNVHGSGGGGNDVDVPSIHQITLGLDHRLNGANETLSAVKEILEGMEGRLHPRGDDDHGSRSGCGGNGTRSSSRPGANGGAASANINIGPGGGGLDSGDAPDMGALLRDIKMQLASELPAINDKISELNVNARSSRDADNRPSPGDDVSGEGVSAGQIGGDLIPLQTKLEELLALVGANQVESAAANQGLREEVTAIVSILEDDVGHREQQVLQQADSVRYLNELNKWLEAFVNNGTSQLQALSVNIDKLCVELGTTTTTTLGGSGSAGGAGSGESNPGGAGSTHLLSNIRQLVLGMKARDQSMASLQAAVNDLVTTLSSEMRIDSKMLVQMMELQKQNQELMLRSFTDEISGEIKGERLRFVEAMKEATAINVQQHVEQFKELGREVLVMAKELERLQHEKRNVEHQIADLFAFYSKQKAGVGLLEDDKPANHNPYLQRSTTEDTPRAARTTKPLVINNARSYRLQSHNQNYYRPTSGRPLPYPREAF